MGVSVSAQEKIFKFNDELCVYEGVFDSSSVTEKQLSDTYKLVQGYYDIYTDQEHELEDTYQNTRTELLNLKIANSTYFKKLRDSLVNFLDLTYKVKKAEFAAKNGNKDFLLHLYQKNPIVKFYSEALFKGGKDLFVAYEYLTKEQMKNNADPERLWEEYITNIKSDQADELAFNRVLTYGWWNAVNHQLPHVNNDGTQFKEFLKLFLEVTTIDCDEV